MTLYLIPIILILQLVGDYGVILVHMSMPRAYVTLHFVIIMYIML